MFRFLHAADVHLDSPLVGLARYESAPVETVRGATRRAFENLVRVAIDEEVAFVLLAGDLYDGNWKDYRTGLFFVGPDGILVGVRSNGGRVPSHGMSEGTRDQLFFCAAPRGRRGVLRRWRADALRSRRCPRAV